MLGWCRMTPKGIKTLWRSILHVSWAISQNRTLGITVLGLVDGKRRSPFELELVSDAKNSALVQASSWLMSLSGYPVYECSLPSTSGLWRAKLFRRSKQLLELSLILFILSVTFLLGRLSTRAWSLSRNGHCSGLLEATCQDQYTASNKFPGYPISLN